MKLHITPHLECLTDVLSELNEHLGDFEYEVEVHYMSKGYYTAHSKKCPKHSDNLKKPEAKPEPKKSSSLGSIFL